jgi:hypothetical protein
MQEEDIFEHIDANCHLCTLYLSYKPLFNISKHLIILLKQIRANVLISALEQQVSWGDTTYEVVDFLVKPSIHLRIR